MIAMQIAKMLVDIIIFLERADEEVLNPDAACDQLEYLGSHLEAMDKEFLRELIDAFQVIALEYGGELRTLISHIAHDFSLEEAVAADDPVRLAELAARRAAEEE